MKSEDNLQMSEGRVWVFLTFTEAQMFLSKTKEDLQSSDLKKDPHLHALP